MLVLSASTDSGGDFLRPIFCFKILLKSLLPVGMGLVTNQHCKYITAPHHSSTFILNTRHCLGCSKPRRLLPYGVYRALRKMCSPLQALLSVSEKAKLCTGESQIGRYSARTGRHPALKEAHVNYGA